MGDSTGSWHSLHVSKISITWASCLLEVSDSWDCSKYQRGMIIDFLYTVYIKHLYILCTVKSICRICGVQLLSRFQWPCDAVKMKLCAPHSGSLLVDSWTQVSVRPVSFRLQMILATDSISISISFKTSIFNDKVMQPSPNAIELIPNLQQWRFAASIGRTTDWSEYSKPHFALDPLLGSLVFFSWADLLWFACLGVTV